MGIPAITIQNISMKYPTPNGEGLEVIRDINLSISKGSFVTIIGPSGCGKSTLLNIVSGLTVATEGEVMLGEKKIVGPEPSKIAMVLQEASLFPWKTVLKNVEFGLELRNVGSKDQRKLTSMKYIDLLGLQGFEDYYPSEISGGMQQRVSVARALALEPEVLLMDEPFGSLDEQTRLLMDVDLERIWQETGKTIVFVTHSLAEAAYLSDVIVVLSARPAKIKEVINVTVKRPRDPESLELFEIRRRLWSHISNEATSQLVHGKH